jgi:hypothetical protein
VYFEVSLFDSVLDPEESHIHGFRSLDLDAIVSESVCDGIVDGDAGEWVLVVLSLFLEGCYVCVLLPIHCGMAPPLLLRRLRP